MHIGQKLGDLALGLGLMTAMFPAAALADSFSSKSNLVCATVGVVACTPDGNCMQGRAQTFDLPSFMFFDFKKNLVRTTDDSGEDSSSPIKSSEITEKAVILQGFENHRGWTAAIDRNDGSLTLSSTGIDVDFMIMGNCTAL